MRWRNLLSLVALTWIVNIAHFVHRTKTSPLIVFQWFVAQLIPWPSLSKFLQDKAWQHWNTTMDVTNDGYILDCPVLDLSMEIGDVSVLEVVEAKYGKNWRDRPLLLKGLWSPSDLGSKWRRLSLSGLLHENLIIPYFMDASAPYALTPDASAPISEIIANMTKGKPHKIGTQWIVQTYPELIQEVAPTELVTQLFGNYFRPESVRGSGPFGMFPAFTTVPVFVARTGATNKGECTTDGCEPAYPRTDLHCEPIGNVAVQLEGEKKWLLVSPEHTFRLEPAVAPDGRAFFASFSSSLTNIPRYQVTQKAGDALWVPTWTWHRVDYVGDTQEIAIGGSLFHFRPGDFVRNNPLFALLIIPNLIKEVIGDNTQ
jgi:hypothetical protein